MLTDFLRTRTAATSAMLAIFGDQATLRHALDFEAALAGAQAAEGLINEEEAAAITQACGSLALDPWRLAEETALAGTLAIPLLEHIRRAIVGNDTKRAVHKGSTSQDVADSVLMLQVKAAAALLDVDLDRTWTGLSVLAERYAKTPAIGRTLLQDALPISFGLRFAQAAAGINAAAQHLAHEVAAHAQLQLGGAAGTRAGLEGRGNMIVKRVADKLGLLPAAPWHARRIGIAAIASALGLVIGALGKFARDVTKRGRRGAGTRDRGPR